MGLQVSLMSTVEAILAWVVSYPNGGILNAILEVKPGTNPTFSMKSDPTKPLLEYFINATLMTPLQLPVLEAIPQDLGGGTKGVEEAQANPNREPVILWTTVSVFLLSLIIIIVVQIVNCCCCCVRVSILNLFSCFAFNNQNYMKYRIFLLISIEIY